MANINSISESDFEEEVLNHPGTVLVDFYTERCGPCQQMAPVLDKLAEEVSSVKIVKINAAENYDLAVKFKVTSVPSFVLFQDGTVQKTRSGVILPSQLKNWLGG
jgi:thioredoxin 1